MSKLWKATAELFPFLLARATRRRPGSIHNNLGPVIACGDVTLTTDYASLEALCFVIRATLRAGVIDPGQQRCLAKLLLQAEAQVSPERKNLVAGSARHADQRVNDWLCKKLFAAALAAPSVQ